MEQLVQKQKVVENLVRRVGKRLREVNSSGEHFEVNTKTNSTDLVTECDIWAENEILNELTAAFPDILLVGEETYSDLESKHGSSITEIIQNNRCWIVDPIDGTTNFTNHIPHVGVSVALVNKGQAEIGVVYDPFRDELFSAAKGAGASLNGRAIGVGDKGELVECVVATGFPYDRKGAWDLCGAIFEKFLANSRGVRRFGAATLDGCWVACGRLDAYYELNLKPWDVAAIGLIVQEAGGISRNFDSDTDSEFSALAKSFLFSNKALSAELFGLVRECSKKKN
jgi:myo-inositol-1(or 4)-monophosphatase